MFASKQRGRGFESLSEKPKYFSDWICLMNLTRSPGLKGDRMRPLKPDDICRGGKGIMYTWHHCQCHVYIKTDINAKSSSSVEWEELRLSSKQVNKKKKILTLNQARATGFPRDIMF